MTKFYIFFISTSLVAVAFSSSNTHCFDGGLKSEIKSLVNKVKSEFDDQISTTQAKLDSAVRELNVTQLQLKDVEEQLAELEIAWPEAAVNGSYCIFMNTNDCPQGLRTEWGGIYWQCCQDEINRQLVRNTWKEVKDNVFLKHYSPSNRKPVRITFDAVTRKFSCKHCDRNLPFILYSHGFNGVADDRFAELYNTSNVILIDWGILASPKHIPVYDAAAHNCIDVGRYVGRMLVALCSHLNIRGSQIHLIGHSLGSHVIGNAGRTFQSERPGDMIGRISALDPAGPRWVEGPVLAAIPTLHRHRLRYTDADFVGVIHTNAAYKPCILQCISSTKYCGDLHQLGHADFYVGQGKNVAGIQPACVGRKLDAFICSHSMAIEYWLDSVADRTKYIGQQCSNIDECKAMRVLPGGYVTNMGEAAVKPSKRMVFYVNPNQGDDNWTIKPAHY